MKIAMTSYPVEDGLNHDDEDDENDHVAIYIWVCVAFSLVVRHHVEAVLKFGQPIRRNALHLLDRPKQFGQLTEKKNAESKFNLSFKTVNEYNAL